MLIKDSNSPLFQHSMVYRPFKYQFLEDLRVQHEKVHWVPDEVELSDDKADWAMNLSEDEKKFVKANLTMFTTGDVAVASNYVDNFIPVFKNNEARNWLLSVAAREGIHQEAYALANDTFGFSESLFGAFRDFKEMRDRIDLMTTKYDDGTVEGLALGLAHTTFNEGVALFGAFVSLLHFQRMDIEGFNGKKGRLKGFGKINAWSLRDESMHVDGATFLFKQVIREHLSIFNDEFKKKVYDLARKFVEAEDLYLDLAFAQFNLPTINKEDVKNYVRMMTDRRLVQLGFKAIFNAKENCSVWLDPILAGAGGKKLTNFFEARVDAYQNAGAMVGEVDWDKVFVLRH